MEPLVDSFRLTRLQNEAKRAEQIAVSRTDEWLRLVILFGCTLLFDVTWDIVIWALCAWSVIAVAGVILWAVAETRLDAERDRHG